MIIVASVKAAVKPNYAYVCIIFIVVIYQIMIIVAAVKCLCIIFYSGNIPNYDNCNCCKMPMYYIL